jgi:hypothetical protein
MSQDRIEDVLKDIKAQIVTTNNYFGTLSEINSHTGNREFRVYQENHICTDNTTTATLGADETFTGDWQDMLQFQEVNVSIKSDQDSALNGLVFQWSADGTNIGDTDVFSYYASGGGTNYTPNPAFRYFRVVYTNGATPQTLFSLQTIVRRGVTGGSFHRIDSTLKDDSDARLVMSVNKLKTSANTWVSQSATNNGNAKISLEELESGISVNSNTQLRTTVFSATGYEGGKVLDGLENTVAHLGVTAEVDRQIRALNVISNEHHEIHEGHSFRASSYLTGINSGQSKWWTFKSSDLYYDHIVWDIDTAINGTIYMYKDVSVNTLGASVSINNSNLALASATGATTSAFFYEDSLGVTNTSGNRIDVHVVGSDGTSATGRVGGSANRSNEWVLKPNTLYAWQFVSGNNSNRASLQVSFYEGNKPHLVNG